MRIGRLAIWLGNFRQDMGNVPVIANCCKATREPRISGGLISLWYNGLKREKGSKLVSNLGWQEATCFKHVFCGVRNANTVLVKQNGDLHDHTQDTDGQATYETTTEQKANVLSSSLLWEE
jgi:hypothetical protein